MKLLYIIVLLLTLSCSKEKFNTSDCEELPSSFKTYSEAKNIIESTDFKFVDDINTSSSSWMRSADYYSCDGEVGFFIYTTDEKKYIHENLPLDVWDGFKNADSFGKFYLRNIKHKYRLVPQNE